MANTKRNRKVHVAGILLSLCALGGVAAAAPNVLFAPEAVITASALNYSGCDMEVEDSTNKIMRVNQYNGTATSLTLPFSPNHKVSDGWKYVIGERAFQNNSTLTSVTIPSGYTVIRREAFDGRTKLKSVTLPDTLKKIDYAAFWNTGLTTVALPQSLTSIGNAAFQSCDYLQTVTYKSGDYSTSKLSYIGSSAFANDPVLTSVPSLPSALTSMDTSVFQSDLKLTKLDFQYTGLTSVPYRTAYGCTGLMEVWFPPKATTIGKQAFYNVGTTNSNSDHSVRFYNKSTTVAINTTNGSVKSRVICVDANNNEANWGTAFEGMKKIKFFTYPNNAFYYGYRGLGAGHSGQDTISKLSDGTASGISVEFDFMNSSTTSCMWNLNGNSLYWILSQVPYPLPGKIYHTSDVVLDSRRADMLRITSVVCKDAKTNAVLADGKPFSQGTTYYYEVKVQPINSWNINLENMKYAVQKSNIKVDGEPDQAELATTHPAKVDVMGISLSDAQAKPVITLRCYVDFSAYTDSSGKYIYVDSYDGSNYGTSSRPKDIYGNLTAPVYYLRQPNAYLESTYNSNSSNPAAGEPRVRLSLKPDTSSNPDVTKGNLFDQDKYWNAGAASVYYALREKGSTASLNYRSTWSLDGLVPEKTYNVYFSSGASDAGRFYVYEFKAPPVLSFTSASLTLEDSLNLNFGMKMTDSFKKSGAYAQFKVQTPSGSVNKNVTISDPVDGTYIFPVKLAAKQLNDNVTLSGYSASGLPSNWVLTKKSTFVYIPERTYTYSAMKYLNAIISGSFDAKYQALAQATKDYGILAQNYFNYNTGAITAQDQSTALGHVAPLDATDFLPFKQVLEGEKPEGFRTYSCSFVCESESILHVYFNLTNSNYNISDYDITYKKPGSTTNIPITPTLSSTNVYVYDITGLKAKDLDAVYEFTVKKKGAAKGHTFKICALNYFYLQRNSTDEKMLDLGKAILLYNQAANDAFES